MARCGGIPPLRLLHSQIVGVTPTIPLHTALIVLIGILFRQNIAAGYLGSWLISNPLTIPITWSGAFDGYVITICG